MAHHPPPAPDWILGEDGHWKPPPFTGGTPPPPPPPGPGSGTGGGSGNRSTMRGRMGVSRRDVVWGGLGLVVMAALITAKFYDTVEVVQFWKDGGPPTREEMLTAPATETDERLAWSMGREQEIILAADGDVVCPAVSMVDSHLALSLPQEIIREGVDREVNGVALSGIECRYGDAVRLGKLDGFEDRVQALRDSTGDTEIGEQGPFPGSVVFTDAEAGTITIVYEDAREVMEAFITVPLENEDDLESLATLTLN